MRVVVLLCSLSFWQYLFSLNCAEVLGAQLSSGDYSFIYGLFN